MKRDQRGGRIIKEAQSLVSVAAWKRKDFQQPTPPLPDSGGMDELLEVLGYKVGSSDMAEVAQKLEQLEMVMGEDGVSQLSDTVHYNPSDLSCWVQSILSELNSNVSDFSSSTNS